MKKEKMRVGVIGAGAISDIYLKNMTTQFRDRLEVVCVAANHIEHAQKRAEQYGPGIRACTTEELLAAPDVDLAVVLTPVGAHAGLIRKALLAGKHVYTEKTIADSPEKAAELLRIADERGLWLGAAPDTFLGAALQTARKTIDEGLLGEIHSFVISANRDNSVLLSVFPFLRQPGAGILYDYGVYYLTALVSLLGPIARVGGIIGKPYPTHINRIPQTPDFGKQMDTPNESQVSAVVQLRSGITGTFHIDADSNIRDEAYFAIYGTKGILYLTDANAFGGTLRFLPNTTNFFETPQPVELWNFTPYRENARGVGPADLAEAVREGRRCRASKEMAFHVLEALTAILQGGETGEFQNLSSSCEMPEPLPVRQIGADNIGHASFNMKNVREMMHFYGDVLGMKEQFSLTYGDLSSLLAMSRENAERDGKKELAEELACRVAELEDKKDRNWLCYMKMADRKFVEFFDPDEGVNRQIPNRSENAGFIQLSFEVDSLAAIRERLLQHEVALAEDIHMTAEGTEIILVRDPDGNEVTFAESIANIAGTPFPEGHSCSCVQCTSKLTFQVRDQVNMAHFYRYGLGLRKAMSRSCAEQAAALEGAGNTDMQLLTELRSRGDQSWIEWYEIAPHQYLEFVYPTGKKLKEDRNLSDAYGYQHVCIEVEDIQAAWDAVTANGLIPDEPIRFGPDRAYQFWLTDPDGNRMELMQYAEDAMQLKAPT